MWRCRRYIVIDRLEDTGGFWPKIAAPWAWTTAREAYCGTVIIGAKIISDSFLKRYRLLVSKATNKDRRRIRLLATTVWQIGWRAAWWNHSGPGYMIFGPIIKKSIRYPELWYQWNIYPCGFSFDSLPVRLYSWSNWKLINGILSCIILNKSRCFWFEPLIPDKTSKHLHEFPGKRGRS